MLDQLTDNSYAIYQLKDGQEYHMLRFASLDELHRDALRLRKDVHHVLDYAEGATFPDKSAVEQFLQGEGFVVMPNDDPEFITVRNASLQEATVYLTFGDDRCWLEGCDTSTVDKGVRQENYDLVYTGVLPDMEEDTPAILDGLYAKFNLDRPDDFHGHSLSVSDVIVLKQQGLLTSYYTDSIGFQRLPDFLDRENPLRTAEMSMEDDLNMIDGIINNGPKEAVEIKVTIEPEKQPKLPKPRHRDDPER